MLDHTHVENSIPTKPLPKKQSDLFGVPYYLEVYDKSYKPPLDKTLKDAFGLEAPPIPKKISIPDDLRNSERLPSCCKGFLKGTCENGHKYAKAILCGKEYCYHCGEKWSWIHQRRYYRWLPKVKALGTVGYLVVTIPLEHREFFLDKRRLNEFRRYCIRLFKRRGYNRGLCRWHWCGEDGNTWHPHLNFLFNEKWISKEDLHELREKICNKISLMMRVSIPTIVINYQYSDKAWKQRHWARYITRATWRKFSEPIAQVVKGYRNDVVWGEWVNKKRENDVAKLERGCCPLCNSKITWDSFQDEINMDDWTLLKAGYFVWNYQASDP